MKSKLTVSYGVDHYKTTATSKIKQSLIFILSIQMLRGELPGNYLKIIADLPLLCFVLLDRLLKFEFLKYPTGLQKNATRRLVEQVKTQAASIFAVKH